MGLRKDRESKAYEALMVMLLSLLVGEGNWSSVGRTKSLVKKMKLKYRN